MASFIGEKARAVLSGLLACIVVLGVSASLPVVFNDQAWASDDIDKGNAVGLSIDDADDFVRVITADDISMSELELRDAIDGTAPGFFVRTDDGEVLCVKFDDKHYGDAFAWGAPATVFDVNNDGIIDYGSFFQSSGDLSAIALTADDADPSFADPSFVFPIVNIVGTGVLLVVVGVYVFFYVRRTRKSESRS